MKIAPKEYVENIKLGKTLEAARHIVAGGAYFRACDQKGDSKGISNLAFGAHAAVSFLSIPSASRRLVAVYKTIL